MTLSACDAADVGVLDECCCCGGSATLGGTQEAVIGSVPSLRYCSTECHDEWEDHLLTLAGSRNTCSTCGYDCGEHAPDCQRRSS